MANTDAYFRHSGHYGFVGFLSSWFITCAAAAVVGAVFGLLEHYCPLIYFNVLMAAGCGYAVGSVAQVTLLRNRVRSPGMALYMGLTAGVVAEYAAFVTWILALTRYRALVISPERFWHALTVISDRGVWTIGFFESPGAGSPPGGAVSGLPLILCWVGEAAIVAGIAAAMAHRTIRNTAYCEACGKWITRKTSILPFQSIPNPANFRARLEVGEFSILRELAPVPATAPSYSYFELRSCPKCNGLHLLSVRNHLLLRDNKGKTKKQDVAVAHNLLIDDELNKAILALKPGEPAGSIALENSGNTLTSPSPWRQKAAIAPRPGTTLQACR